ncbi:MAG: hypothetical protein A3C36_04910 [Omnitrophica WOR_2 bacterium RIFCSPHIGHO2_02_FULL_52_10]|nr:MAG: hypothetical protein A3C36_04910 [Omnitrophica WOR_2 bacterium RIFCSPHIGHO2_02_FULL_52_10]
MGVVRKIGEEYYIEFYARGLLYQQKAGRDRDAAERMLKDVEGKIQNGEMGILVRDADIDIFLKTFLEHCRKDAGPRTYRRFASAAAHFQEYCANSQPKLTKLSAVTPGVIEHYRVFLIRISAAGSPPVKPKVVNLTLFLLKIIFDHAIKLGYLNDNPLLHTRWVEVKNPKTPRTLTGSEIEKLSAHCGDDLIDIVTVVLGTGMRVSELIRLVWTKIDFKHKTIKIEVIYRCGGEAVKERTLPIGRDIEAVLERFRMKNATGPGLVFVADNGKPLEEKRLKEELRQAAIKAGIEGPVNFEILRGTFAREVLSRGVSLADVHRLLGLSDIAKVMRYAAFAQGKQQIQF